MEECFGGNSPTAGLGVGSNTVRMVCAGCRGVERAWGHLSMLLSRTWEGGVERGEYGCGLGRTKLSFQGEMGNKRKPSLETAQHLRSSVYRRHHPLRLERIMCKENRAARKPGPRTSVGIQRRTARRRTAACGGAGKGPPRGSESTVLLPSEAGTLAPRISPAIHESVGVCLSEVQYQISHFCHVIPKPCPAN